eukprot:s1725_g26.t1
MELVVAGDGSGGVVPDQDPANHPPVAGGALVGHGGAALRVYIGMTPLQAEQFVTSGQVEAPLGRGSTYYWAMKTTAEAAAQSVTRTHARLAIPDVVVAPVTVTFVGLLEMVRSGHLYCVDSTQWRLYAPLRVTGPRGQDDVLYYEVHPSVQLP